MDILLKYHRYALIAFAIIYFCSGKVRGYSVNFSCIYFALACHKTMPISLWHTICYISSGSPPQLYEGKASRN